MKLNKLFFYWGPVVVWCLVIFAFSSIPTLPKVGFIWWDFVLKKSAHIIEYGILYLLVWRAITGINFQFSIFRQAQDCPEQSRRTIFNFQSIINFQFLNKKIKIKKIYWILPLLLGILYAISDEYHQSFVMGRTARVRDVGFDAAGMMLSAYLIKRKLKM